MLVNIISVKQKIINIPLNILITIIQSNCIIENRETKIKRIIEIPCFLEYILMNNILEFKIKSYFYKFQASKMMFYTFVSKFRHILKGISEAYRGVINLQGLGYSVAITKLALNKYNLFFRFGFKDKYNYVMPNYIKIENFEVAKTKIIIYCSDIELLKNVQINIQRLRYPKAYKLQGIYLNDKFPKIKKFIK
jgi:ribosomal protein L6P/L9E